MDGISSVDQVDNSTPPTSPLYRDSDEDDDGGPRPSELYGGYTWEIEKYSQITEEKLQSNVFEAGSYKWYILFYPRGTGVSNKHLSFFLCVANADKLLPGWRHLAHYAIGVVNKASEKSYYRDTLHSFWKKSDIWGWNTFMELSELEDGFINDDTLIIEAYVQVIRERVDRPFRCLDPQYRELLIEVYLTDVEQIFFRFVEEKWDKLGKLIEDRTRWSSFCAFWSNVDPASRRRMSLVKMDSILKAIVKHFPIDSGVAVFVMDSLYNGLKTLKGQHKGKKSKDKAVRSHTEGLSVHFVRIEKDSFILVDDALQLLERAASGPFPPKDEKGPQDGAAAEEFDEDTDERDDRRPTELGCQTIEIFVLEQIFSEIEAAVNGTPSSPLCLDSDEDEDEDEDEGPEPSELHQKHTWEINKYSQITKRILRSKAFEAGGCKWYILFYPQGNGVSNKHLSLFLCVANSDKLLPGWSHFAHFTLSVVHKGSKEFFYQDGLHRFWKKDDEWGWDQFMEISELEDGFIDDDTLIIRAGVQVIRERVDRPFACLEPEYRGVEWYRTEVEQIFHDYVLKRLAKLRKLTEDLSRWSSFCAFWSNVDPASRRHMSRVEMDSTLKAILKHFPIDSRVSIFVMDSLYNGLKALKGQHKGKKSKDNEEHSHAEEEDLSLHFIRVEKDSFILVDDALQLLERAASGPFPPKDEKGPQDKDTIERRLTVTELGREAIELFVLRQIFSKIQTAYQALSNTPSSTLCWDSDEDEDDDGGPTPSELYGWHTWEINKYSRITKRSLRSKAFEAGGCKWYILFYPQGNGVSNKHLSFFLCVANRDKLLPGWGHLAFFTIAVVNNGSKELILRDVLHRFWKKDDQCGWSKFMELSMLADVFIDDDTLIIEAHVQVISERADRPFPCLDPQYRSGLMRWYRAKVEQIFRHFVEERLAKLRKLREDKSRWSRRRMSLVKMDSVLKAIVKHFPIDSEVVSIFVMDSIYNGLKTLKEGQHKGKKSKDKAVHSHTKEALSVHFIRIEKDSFILMELDDALQLLERAKDEKGPQDKDTIERRLTELGRYTIEIFVLEQIFSKIEAAYEEDVAFKKQEELIREEEEGKKKSLRKCRMMKKRASEP